MYRISAGTSVGILCVLGLYLPAKEAAPWSTYRGNPQRSANADDRPGPATPQVLWSFKPKDDHFIAAPVPAGDRLFISGFGAFNVSTFYCLNTEPKAARRVAWSKTIPYLKLPTVSSPAVADGLLIFGDGMHQTDDALLHCLRMEKGMPLWQLPVNGKLVHLEGSPTVVGTKVYIGGGAAGVLCVDLDRVMLNGKERSLAAIQKLLDAKWQELLVKYQAAKKKDPDLAVPPDVDQLPKPAPRRVWQQGKGLWHVDASVAVVGERVLAASAFLDKERAGDRALFCLDTRTGQVKWRTPLKFNPWGGPSVVNDLVVVGGSTIGYDPKALREAKGEVVAINLTDGKIKWRKSAPGGVVACVALADGAAVATATDGTVCVFELATGRKRWFYNAHAPFFAPPAVAGGIVYAGDLKGVLHAVDLTKGTVRWKLDLGTAAAVKAPGMIYGGPVVHDGRIYVATCNVDGANAMKSTVVVCIGTR